MFLKKILIDIYKANNPHSGLGQFSINFYNELCRQKPQGNKFTFLHPSNFPQDKELQFNYKRVSAMMRVASVIGPKPDIWHSLHQFPSHPPHPKSKQILTIHDLNFLTEKDSSKADRYLKRLQKNVDRADVITTISNYTKTEVQQHLDLRGRDIHVIHNGVALGSFEGAKKPAFMDNGPYFFSIGIFSAKKNFEVLLPLLKKFPRYKLVIAGNNKTSYGNTIAELAKKLDVENQLVLPGKISDEDKYWLYKNCRAFLFPSLAEGFGLPVIEACLAGKPVFISDRCSLPEVGGTVANYWTNFDPEYMRTIIDMGLAHFDNTSDHQNDLINWGTQFNWRKCIRQYLDLYESI